MKTTKIKLDEVEQYLIEHILKGDRGDGIPNVLSADNCIVDNIRQNKLTTGRKEALKGVGMLEADEETLQRIKRNRALIDLREIPAEVQQEILDNFNNQKPQNRSKLFNYFVKFKLKNLMDCIGDF